MRSGRFIVLFFVVCFGLGPAAAQDIFINKYKDKDNGQQRSVYIKRSQEGRYGESRAYQFKKTARQVFARDKLTFAVDAKTVTQKIAVFRAWEKSDRRPETMEEIRSYAASKRAIHEASMLHRRKDLIIALESEEKTRQTRLAREDFQRSGSQRISHAASAGTSSSKESDTAQKTSRIVITKPSVFVRPDGEKKSKGVFTKYR